MERYLREVIGNQLILNNSPPPPFIPEFIIYLLIKPTFEVFTLAIKFDCLFLGVFKQVLALLLLVFRRLLPKLPYNLLLF